MPSCCSARSSLRHHHEEVIAEAAQQRPAADAPIPAPQPLEPCGMTVFHPGHVGGWGEKAERPAMYEGEIARKPPIELHGSPVSRPHRMPVHPDWCQAAREPHADAAPVPARSVVGDLPRAPAADHREDEATAALEEPRALA